MKNRTGKQLGRYSLIEEIGRGGMASVWEAYDPHLDRYVAIKILRRELGRDVNSVERFQREARLLASLYHPNIIRIDDFGESDGELYLVMQFIEGPSIREVIEERLETQDLIEMPAIISIILDIARALDHAHQRGIIHGDVKAANIQLTPDNRAILLDLGMAAVFESLISNPLPRSIKGTPQYIAPEIILGEKGDARSDIYALGITFYQLLTGEVPYDAETSEAMYLMHVHDPLPSPREKRSDLPRAVERIIFKALMKNPDHRYQTAGEMANDLAAIKQGYSPEVLDFDLVSSTASIDQNQMRMILATYFNTEELRSLCLDLQIDYENFPHTRDGMVRELVQYCLRHSRYNRLEKSVRQLRRDLDF